MKDENAADVELAPKRAARIPPHSIEAEESLLGAMLLTHGAIDTGLKVLASSADFYKPGHAQIFDAIVAAYERGDGVDTQTVADELRERGLLEDLGGRGALARLQAATPVSANAAAYARTVARAGAYRRALGSLGEIAEMVYSVDHSLEDVLQVLDRLPDHVAMPSALVEPGIDALDLVSMEFDYRWLVPGILRRLDRIMVTGLEGFSGKTEYNVQTAVQMASGIHPWTREFEYTPLRVTYLDFENSLDQLQPRIRRLVRAAGDRLQPGMLTIRSLPEGLNLREPKGSGFIDGLCEMHKPDVLVLGPIYRMFEGSRGMPKHSEECCEEVTRVLDRIRVRHDCALIIEAHAPHGSENDRAGLRPYGASLWLRWPEMGVGLAPMRQRDQSTRKMVVVPGKFTFEFWRGTRDQDLRRPWPSGVMRWNTWSFIPIDDSEVF